MNVAREDVMVYGMMIAAFCTGMAGLCFDVKMYGLCTALGIIAAGATLCAALAYLNSPPDLSISNNGRI